MKKIVNGLEIKLTRADYLYINNIKHSDNKLSPLNIPQNLDTEVFTAVHNMVNKKWRMVNA